MICKNCINNPCAYQEFQNNPPDNYNLLEDSFVKCGGNYDCTACPCENPCKSLSDRIDDWIEKGVLWNKCTV